MNSFENLHFAIGEIAYAVAMSDGKLQKEEEEQFNAIIYTELHKHHYGFNVADIIFKIISADKTDSDTSYHWGIKTLQENALYLSPELKQTFISVIEKIAQAFPSKGGNELRLLSQFKKDMEPLHGNAALYK